MTRYTFHKLILHTVHVYLTEALKEEQVYQKETLRKVRSALLGFHTFHKFTPKEQKELQKIGEDEFLVKIKKVEVDWSVYAMELLTLYLDNIPKEERRFIPMSDAKIKMHKVNMIKDMLRLRGDEEAYKRVKEVIEQSKLTAKQFFFYFFELI